MDKQKHMSELQTSITELRTSQTTLLKRVNQLVSSGENQSYCNCKHRAGEFQDDISQLQTECVELKCKVTENENNETKLADDVVELQRRVDAIETLLESREADISILEQSALINEGKNETPTSREEVKESTGTTKKVSEQENNSRLYSGNVGVSSPMQPKATNTNGSHQRSFRKPNFVNTLNKNESKGEIVKQDVKLVFDGEIYWRSAAQRELESNRLQFFQLEGVHSIICLDISESMSADHSWSQARAFLTDYLTGLEEMSRFPGLKTEYVAVVTFGHETKFQIRYTDRYSEIEHLIGNFKLGGPSQMYGGALYALAAAWCSRHQITRLDNSCHIHTKIIVITDGKATESDLIAGPDIADSRKMDETKAKILQEMENFRKNHIDLFFVPVGLPDATFMESMEACSEGMSICYNSGRRLARRQYLCSRLLDPLGLVTNVLTLGPDEDLSVEDKEDMRNIQERAKRSTAEIATTVNNVNMYAESGNRDFPPIGSRVRRGPDWIHEMQDNNGPGTIIGHSEVGEQVWVEWDSREQRNIYRYGMLGYDILLVDEPRVLNQGQVIVVGCVVKPGKDWRASGDIPQGHGVVIRLDKRNKKANVRWNNGKRGDYSYGVGGLQEIEIKEEHDGHSDQTSSNDATVMDQSNVGDSRSNSIPSSEVRNHRRAETIEEYAARQNIFT